MLDKINHYKVSKGIREETMQYYGFVQNSTNDEKLLSEYCFGTCLENQTILFISIKRFRDRYRLNTKVLNSNMCSIYEPFYGDVEVPGLDPVIDSYNQKMDDMVEAGILTKKLKPSRKKGM